MSPHVPSMSLFCPGECDFRSGADKLVISPVSDCALAFAHSRKIGICETPIFAAAEGFAHDAFVFALGESGSGIDRLTIL